ncbi:chemotaxis protein CheW [Oceanospirillum sp.]|uniref:chemotaxis protein CheW n=1 Tax=Oceanospirillum sp. TaxID=2021254 RepID=UPI003A928547
MAHDSQDLSPQEAIEGYLEALLQDVSEYDEPEVIAEPAVKSQAEDVVSAASPKIATDYRAESITEDVDASSSQTNAPEEAPARIFAPPSAREYAREVAAEIRQRHKVTESQEPKPVETVFQDTPPVVMPELKVAEPKVEIALTEENSDLSTAAPQVDVQVAEVETKEAVVEVEVEVSEPVASVVTEASEEAQELDQSAVSLESQENEGWSNGRPDWAQGRFECLLFVVKGLKLAVPLAELGGIHKLEKEPTPLFGQPGWFLGIVRTNNMNVGLVDTAQWVMPEHINDKHKPDFGFAIRIHDSEWGLACHTVAEAISLDPDEVRWRTSLGRRPWLAGTVVDHMCALIDVAAFARLLDSDKVPVDLQALMADEE